MKLISKYKDYYDSLLYNYSTEKTPVWDRKLQTYNLNEYIEFLSKEQRDLLIDMSNFSAHRPYYGNLCDEKNIYFRYIVGFCGKVIQVNTIINNNTHTPYTNINEFIKETKKDKRFKDVFMYESFCDDYRSYQGVNIFGRTKKSDKIWHDIYDDQKRIYDIFIALNTPIFLIPCASSYHFDIKERKIIINPVLKDINFQKIKDPFSTFQEIERFVTNDLVKEISIPEFSDDIKRDCHGFGDMSFKKRGKK